MKAERLKISRLERVISNIENGTHPSLIAEKTAFDTEKQNLDKLQKKKLHLEDGKKSGTERLDQYKEENGKLTTKHTETQAKLAKLPELMEMDRLLNIVQNSHFIDEKAKAEKLLQKMRLDLDPASRLYNALNGTDTTSRRAAIETEKTHRARESLFIQGSELPNWMSEPQKEKILKAREKIGEIYSQVDILHNEAKSLTEALEKDPKIATAEQFSKEVNAKVGVINNKITRLSPLIDDVIREVSVAFPGLNRTRILQELKVPSLPNA